jgi:hypothetical protein
VYMRMMGSRKSVPISRKPWVDGEDAVCPQRIVKRHDHRPQVDRVMPVERRGWVIAFEIGSTGNGRNPTFNGRRQPSCGGTSRMTRGCQVRICERLGVKFPGPTRPRLPNGDVRFHGESWRVSGLSRRPRNQSMVTSQAA